MFKLEVLQEKPWYLQAALFGGVALVLYIGFWYFVTGSTRSETREIEAKVEELQRANAGAQIASQRLNEFKANYAAAQADYDDLKALLPEQRELTMVLQNVQDRARGKLTLRRFMPKDEVQQDFYSGKPVEVEVSGTYHNVGQFFAQMATYQRIVSITDFRVQKIKDNLMIDKKAGKTVSATFLLTAYYVSPEKIMPAAPAPNGQPNAAVSAAPASPQAAASQAAIVASSAPTAVVPEQLQPVPASPSASKEPGRAVPPPGGSDNNYWKNKEKIDSATRNMSPGTSGTVTIKPDGSVSVKTKSPASN